MSNLFILRKYAEKAPSSIPSSILFSSSPKTLTIFDAFPKSIFHFLVLPRLQSELSTGINEKDLDSLRTLLRSDKQTARAILNALNEDAKEVKRQIEEEMMKRYKFTWYTVSTSLGHEQRTYDFLYKAYLDWFPWRAVHAVCVSFSNLLLSNRRST